MRIHAHQILALLVVLITGCVTTRETTEWRAPKNPDPGRILREARADTKAQRYEEALAKFLWFHENALTYRESLYGVRLSYALEDWFELGSVYPPALEELKRTRDDAAVKVREADEYYYAFNDVLAINDILGESNRTVELFLWLDLHMPERARKVYRLVQVQLVDAGDFQLCGKYIDPTEDFNRIVWFYRAELRMAKDPKFGSKMRIYATRTFSQSTATLVAILARNDRIAEAKIIVEEALNEWDERRFRLLLQAALSGELPKTLRPH